MKRNHTCDRHFHSSILGLVFTRKKGTRPTKGQGFLFFPLYDELCQYNGGFKWKGASLIIGHAKAVMDILGLTFLPKSPEALFLMH